MPGQPVLVLRPRSMCLRRHCNSFIGSPNALSWVELPEKQWL
jgi:hypothetical protein